ncbi:MAG: glycosyltransferase family 4 protein [Spirochaetaceae bacterium]|nr:glycosyltransferase family 4 protein [Spirochaetaceae bacterium]
MYRIAVNGINSKTGGGKSILHNYLTLLDKSVLHDRYLVLTPDPSAFEWISNDHIAIVHVPAWYGKTIASPFVYEVALHRVLARYRIDLVFNMGDLVVHTGIKQVYLFDWSYAIHPTGVVWKLMDRRDWFIRKVKLCLLRRRIRRPAVTIAQTPVAKEALHRLHGLTNVTIVPNAVSLDNLDSASDKTFDLPAGKRLLYLTYYYPHKNLEVLLPVARRIRELGRDYKIIITIDASQHKKSERLLDDIRTQELDAVILNVGPVKMEQVPALYRSCDALLMPTLLESFSGAYVEAMFHRIPIFTSNLNFAKAVCRDAACYFDPHDADDIVSKMDTVFDDPTRSALLVEAGRRVLADLPDWPRTFTLYQDIIRDELRGVRH